MSKEVSTTEEAVLKAAEKFPHTKDVLKTLFPEAFKVAEEAGTVDCTKGNISFDVGVRCVALVDSVSGESIIGTRFTGKDRFKSFYLSEKYSWSLEKQQNNLLTLIPTRKN